MYKSFCESYLYIKKSFQAQILRKSISNVKSLNVDQFHFVLGEV